jgi:hypothetical protein
MKRIVESVLEGVREVIRRLFSFEDKNGTTHGMKWWR